MSLQCKLDVGNSIVLQGLVPSGIPVKVLAWADCPHVRQVVDVVQRVAESQVHETQHNLRHVKCRLLWNQEKISYLKVGNFFFKKKRA